jgi:nucleoside-diphosphate-sugar epimerase
MILLTGVAGFIGMHLARRLLAEGQEVVGIDHLGPCAEPGLKERRLAGLLDAPTASASSASTSPTARRSTRCSANTASGW